MAWNLKLNGDPVSLEVANAAAVLPSPGMPPPEVENVIETVGGHAGALFEHYDHGERDRQVFERAGWRFVQPESPAVDALDRRISPGRQSISPGLFHGARRRSGGN